MTSKLVKRLGIGIVSLGLTFGSLGEIKLDNKQARTTTVDVETVYSASTKPAYFEGKEDNLSVSLSASRPAGSKISFRYEGRGYFNLPAEYVDRIPASQRYFREDFEGTHVYLALPKGMSISSIEQKVIVIDNKTDEKLILDLVAPKETRAYRVTEKINEIYKDVFSEEEPSQDSGSFFSRLFGGEQKSEQEDSLMREKNAYQESYDLIVAKVPGTIGTFLRKIEKIAEYSLEKIEEERLKKIKENYPNHNIQKMEPYQYDGNFKRYSFVGREFNLSLDSSGTAKDLSECYAIIPSIRFIKPYPNDAEATVRDVEIKFNEILKDTGKSLEALPEEFVGTWRERGCVCDKNIGGEFRIMYKDGKIIFGRTDIGRARGRYGGYDGLDMLTGIGQASSFKEMESGVSFLVDDLTTTEKEKKPYYVNRLPKKDDWDMTEWIGEKEKVGFQRAMIPLEGREGYRVEDFKN